MLDDTDEYPPLDLPTFHGLPEDLPGNPGRFPDPTDDGLGCSDGGEWRDADPDLWAFGACVVLALLVAGAVWMLAAG